MSWQQWIDQIMDNSKLIHGGIFGLDGSQWAASPAFSVSFTFTF